jgi:gamma-glutamyltranspeptidase/glutathione hydrolase
LRAADFAAYQIKIREPIRTKYRGYDIVSFPPPSSGGVHVAQMLNILEAFDLKSMDEASRYHVIAEAMKLAFADRAFWLGDPDFVKVPRGLVSTEYARNLSGEIDKLHAIVVPEHNTPLRADSDVFGDKHTTHFSVVDAEGNWVACTATVNTGFGSKVVVPGTGVLLNDQMDDFSAQPGVANYFGLVGAEANAVAPGKRPLSSMSPTIVLKDGNPLIALGAAGGPKIISAVLIELVHMLDLGETPQQAVAAPRIHQQWSPDELMFEKTLPEPVQTALSARGHKLKEIPHGSTSQIVARSADGKGFVGAADPRGGGSAAGW